MDEQPSPEYLKYDFKKMKKNGYILATLNKSIEDANKGDEVMISANEFGTMDEDAIITCYTKDKKEIMVPKHDLNVKK